MIAYAAEQLTSGQIGAIPTETVYGLAADATNPEAVVRVYQTKQRPHFNPLICHYASLELLAQDVMLDPRAEMLAHAFWPGPMTLVLPKTPGSHLATITTAGLPTAAVRMPAHPVARALLAALPFPLAAPSANPSGRLSPTSATHVAALLDGRIDWVLDGGECSEGVESTIIDLSTPQATLLRYGTLTPEAIEAIIGPIARFDDERQLADPHTPKAPGMLLRHYAPQTPLRLGTDNPQPGEVLLGFGDTRKIGGHFVSEMNLSPSGDLAEAARHCFDYLHRLDAQGASGIAVSPIPETGLGHAINDRLRRAGNG